MSRERIICVLLLCLASSTSSAQDEPDLSALTFTLGPVSDVVLWAPPSEDELAPTDRELEDGERGRLRESAQELTESISAEEALNGSWSTGLIDPLTSLAATYQELGEDILALGALERAKQVVRRNDGLHSLDQAVVVMQMIESVEAAGQLAESASLQNALLELALRNEGDPRAPSVLAAVADKQMAAVDEYLDTGRWPGIRESPPEAESTGWVPQPYRAGRHLAAPRLGEILNDYDAAIEEALADDDYVIPDSLGSDAALAETSRLIETTNDFVEQGNLWEWELPWSDRGWALAALRRARRLYGVATQAARSSSIGSYEDGEYWALQEQLIETYSLERDNPDLHSDNIGRPEDVIYLTGAAVLETRVIDKLIHEAPALDVATALVELADWYALYSLNGMAMKEYQDAYDFLVTSEVPVETITELFSPEVPVVLPALGSRGRPFVPTQRYRGYIDVSIDVGRFGQITRMNVLAASPAASDEIENRLRRHIGESRFRPRFVDGRPSRSDEFALRYYFDF